MLECARATLHADQELPSLNALAHIASVGVGTVYRHFPTTRVLLESIAADSFGALLATVRELTDEPDGSRAFETMIRVSLEFQAKDPGLAALLASPTFECADVEKIANDFFDVVSELLSRARRDGALRSDLDADDLRRLIAGTALASRGLPSARSAKFVDVLLAGLREPTLAD